MTRSKLSHLMVIIRSNKENFVILWTKFDPLGGLSSRIKWIKLRWSKKSGFYNLLLLTNEEKLVHFYSNLLDLEEVKNCLFYSLRTLCAPYWISDKTQKNLTQNHSKFDKTLPSHLRRAMDKTQIWYVHFKENSAKKKLSLKTQFKKWKSLFLLIKN